MNLLLVAHGTRKPAGVAMIGDLAERVGATLGRPVHVAFVDVLGPTPPRCSRAARRRPAVLVPAFLASGYHVRVDIPAHVAASGHPDVTVTDALGPWPQIVRVLADRLVESGWRPGDSVILAAAGTSDARAQRDLRVDRDAAVGGHRRRVELAYAATGSRGSPMRWPPCARRAPPRGRRVIPVGGRPVPGSAADQRRRRGDRSAGDASRRWCG